MARGGKRGEGTGRQGRQERGAGRTEAGSAAGRRGGSRPRRRGGASHRPASAATSADRPRWPTAALCAGLALATLAVYAQVRSHAFNNFDTQHYVWANPVVQQGLTWEGVRWAFTTFTTANWHPLTWLSIMLDCQLFGLDPGAHHLMSAALHAATSCALLVAFVALTGSVWPSALAAALFALHPLHVESVAWGAQRKDVLSTFFLALTLLAYARYARRPAPQRLVPAILACGLGLLAKPMLVSAPLLLGVLDFWPLRRLPASPGAARPDVPRVPWRRAAAEKLPFLVLAAIVAVATVVAQQSQGAVQDLRSFPLPARLANAAVATATYLGKTLWPVDLAVFYPHPGSVPAMQWIPALALLAGLTALVWRVRDAHPWAPAGWLWFGISLVPVIGIVQVGSQALADRYTYVPHIGLLLAGAFGLAELVRRRPSLRVPVAAGAAAAVCALALVTHRQVSVWQSSESLYGHALAVTSDNAKIHYNLAGTRFRRGDFEAALRHYREVVRIDPDYPSAHYSLGTTLRRLGRDDEARRHFERELERHPAHAESHNNLGDLAYRAGAMEEALARFERALEARPDDPSFHGNAAAALMELGRMQQARSHLDRALALDPENVAALANLADWLQREGRVAEAQDVLRRALERAPGRRDLRERLESLRRESEGTGSS